MTPLTDKQRLEAALDIAQSLFESVEKAEGFPTGTRFIPIGIEDDVLFATIQKPGEATSERMDRIPLRRGDR